MHVVSWKNKLTENAKLPFEIVLGTADHHSMIMASWMRSYRNTMGMRFLTPDVYIVEQHALCEKLLDNSIVLVARWKEEPDEIYGWLCYDRIDPGGLVVHFIYVKKMFRRLGIAAALLEQAGCKRNDSVIATHHTYAINQSGFALSKLRIKYNPYLGIRLAYEN